MSNEELLAQIGRQTEETEFYTPMPEGYRPGHHKFVIVVGTVMSGLGKGIFSSSLAKLLKDKGMKVAPIKMEGYLNIDAGTLNPYRHGEVFVLDDGTECDMDLGTYERLLDQNLSRRNFMTSGQVFSTIVDRERHGAYLGRDVQWIPHVTGEVKRRLRGAFPRTVLRARRPSPTTCACRAWSVRSSPSSTCTTACRCRRRTSAARSGAGFTTP